jgi:glycosyltransferase involved in cell wall biosynthesis
MRRVAGRHGHQALGVLHITNDFAPNGTGITSLLYTLARAQVEAGLSVHIASSSVEESYTHQLLEQGVVFHRVPRLTGLDTLARIRSQLRRIVGDHGLDIVHTHTVKATVVSLSAGRRIRRRTVATIHNSFQRSSRLMLLTFRPVAVSKAVREEMGRLGRLRLPQRTTVIPNGVRARSTGGMAPSAVSRRTALYVGGLHHRKGVDVILHAFARVAEELPDTNLVIAGRRDAPEIEDLACALGLGSRVTFLGLLADPGAAMAQAGVVLVPSRHEPFGLVAAEARLAGAPVLASDTGGLREVLDGGAAGQLLPVGDVAAWSGAMTAVLSNPAYRDDWAQRSACGAGRFDDRVMAEAYEQLYRGLVGGVARPFDSRGPLDRLAHGGPSAAPEQAAHLINAASKIGPGDGEEPAAR